MTASSSSSSTDGGLSNAASGGIGAAATVAVFGVLVAALYAAGMVRFGRKRNDVSLDSASVTSSEHSIKQAQQSRVQVRAPPLIVADRVPPRI
jgi:Na+/glutamate symporter